MARKSFTVPTAGTLVVLSADETSAVGTVSNPTAKSYLLPANNYSLIVVETEVALTGAPNTECNVRFDLTVGGVIVDSTRLVQAATGQGDFFRFEAPFKWSGLQQASTTIILGVTVALGAGTWNVKGLRVYGTLP